MPVPQSTAAPPLGLLDRLAVSSNGKAANPFDQFDPPPSAKPASNPFDQFDTPSQGTAPDASDLPPLPPGATLVSRGSLAMPGANASDLPPLPPGATLITRGSLATSPGARLVNDGQTSSAPAAPPGLIDRLQDAGNKVGGIAGRGILGGASDIIGLGQAIGRAGTWADRQIGIEDPKAWTAATNYDVRGAVENEEDRQGFAKPTGAIGRAAEAGIEGVVGGALTGGTTSGLLGLNAAAGAAGSLGQAAGLSPGEAAALTFGIGGGGAALGAARSAAGDAAANYAVRSTAPAVANDTGAAQSVLRTAQMLDDAKAAAPKATPAQTQATVVQNLQTSLTAHVAGLQRAGLVGKDDAATLRSVISSAADPNHTGAGLLDAVDQIVPGSLAAPLRAGVNDLNTAASGVLTAPVAGPLRSLAATTARYGAPAAAALAGLHAGNLAPLAEGAAGLLGYAHRPLSAAGATAGSLLDRLAGTRVVPSAALTDAARSTLNGAAPDATSLAQLAQARQTLSTPEGLFGATGGAMGSPAGAMPAMNGFRVGPDGSAMADASGGLSKGSPAAPGGSPQGSMPSGVRGPVASPGGAPARSQAAAYGPFPAAPNAGGLVQPPTGGKALATMMHGQTFGGPAPTAEELTSAIDSIADAGLVHPDEAAAAHDGLNISPAFALTIAHRVNAARSASVPADAATQAQAEVASLTSGGSAPTPPAVPFGTDASGAPIRNPTAYQGARDAYAQHAATLMSLATSPAEKLALSRIAAAPRGVDKQAIMDVYSASNANADLSRFTPQLLAGR